MTILDNPRHEAFAQAFAAGATADDAYAQAGFKADRGHASRLAASEAVRARIQEIQGRAAAKLEISLQYLLEKAEEARQAAMACGQPSAAVAAIKELGVLSGHRVEKRENLNRSLDQLSDAELTEIARGGAIPKRH